jgi:hypothetical protein
MVLAYQENRFFSSLRVKETVSRDFLVKSMELNTQNLLVSVLFLQVYFLSALLVLCCLILLFIAGIATKIMWRTESSAFP